MLERIKSYYLRSKIIEERLNSSVNITIELDLINTLNYDDEIMYLKPNIKDSDSRMYYFIKNSSSVTEKIIVT